MRGFKRAAARAFFLDLGVTFGAVAAVLIGGLAFGRALTAGRAEVVDWLPMLIACGGVAVVCGLVPRLRRGCWPLAWATVGAVGVVLLFCGVATDSFAGHFREGGDDGKGTGLRVGVISALDIAWRPDGATPPLAAALGAGVSLTPVSRIDEAALDRFDRLLIVQPRLLQPAELVALDAWVRQGGRAVVLADPWLHWPSDLPQGDRRRAPLTSLLDPILSHWGLVLEPADMGRGVERRFVGDGALMAVAGASRFSRTGGDCILQDGGLTALCRIGRGTVRLVADADLADDRLWLSDSRAPADRALWSADTPDLLRSWLRDPVKRSAKSATPWIRSDGALIGGVRWALLAGLVWAMLGTGLSWGWSRLGRTGKKPGRAGQPASSEERRKND